MNGILVVVLALLAASVEPTGALPSARVPRMLVSEPQRCPAGIVFVIIDFLFHFDCYLEVSRADGIASACFPELVAS